MRNYIPLIKFNPILPRESANECSMLTSEILIKEIIQYLRIFRQEIDDNVKLGLTDISKKSENFVCKLLNQLYNLRLENANSTTANYPALDLIDSANRISYQVTSTNDKKKIQDTIDKFIQHNLHLSYNSLNIFILTNKKNTYTLNIPNHLNFTSSRNIQDFDDITRELNNVSLDKLSNIHKCILSELPYNLTNTYPIQLIDIEKKYLNKIADNKTYAIIDEKYVELFSINTEMPDNIGIEVLEEGAEFLKYQSEYDFWDEETYDKPTHDTQEKVARVDSILNISNDTKNFILIGGPGTGKTTSLTKILYQNISRAIQNATTTRIPVLINANNYVRTNNEYWIELIAKELNTSLPIIYKLLSDGKLQCLVDGMNEIDTAFRAQAETELKTLITAYPDVSFIISTRIHEFTNNYELPVFALKELQEHDIKQFISKRKPEILDKLWAELDNNKQLLQLASNPMMLYMIVNASKDGSIPKNRGTLYDFFVRHMLETEYLKIHTTEKKTKRQYIYEQITALATLGFKMRELGVTKISNEILEDLQNADLHTAITLIDKNPLLKDFITLEFIHESFVEYFCALQINTWLGNYTQPGYTLSDIGIDNPSQANWFEPLIMCGDLYCKKTATSVQAKNYLTFLFTGEYSTNKNTRKITRTINADQQAFTHADLNKEIKTACKVAYNLKNNFPSIFEQAEKWLSNYLTIWLSNYRKQNAIIPLENLLAAVASLSSEKLFRRILLSPDWQEIWLYCPTDDISNKEEKEVNFNAIENNRLLFHSFINNNSDCTIILSVLDSINIDNVIFPKILFRLKRIKTAILYKATVSELKRIYLSNPLDFDLLFFIGKTDLEFLITNCHGEVTLIDRLILFSIEHFHLKQARQYLYEIIEDKTTTKTVKIPLISHFLKSEFRTDIFPWVETEIENQGQYANFILRKLKDINFFLLSDKMREKLSAHENEHPAIPSLKSQYRLWKSKKGKYFIKFANPTLEEFFFYRSLREINVPELGNAKVGEYKLVDANGQSKPIFRIKSGTELVDSSFVLTIEFDEQINVKAHQGTIIFDYTLLLNSHPSLFDIGEFETTILHPDILAKKPEIMTFFEACLSTRLKKRICDLLYNNNWLHKFYLHLDTLPSGIVTWKKGQIVEVFLKNKNRTVELIDTDDTLKVGAVGILEKNGRFIALSDNHSRTMPLGFKEGQVIRVDHENQIGHIFRPGKGSSSDKDYFFHFSECDTPLIPGDNVTFFPIVGPTGNPKALNVKKERDPETCELLSVAFNMTYKNFYGECRDIKSQETYHYTFRGNLNSAYIKSITIQKNKIYRYIDFRPTRFGTKRVLIVGEVK